MKKLINLIIYPLGLCCYLCWKVFSFDYKQLFINITNPKWNPNIIVGRALTVAMVTSLVIIAYSFINAIFN